MKINSKTATGYHTPFPETYDQMDKNQKYRLRPSKDILEDDRVKIVDRSRYINILNSDGKWECLYVRPETLDNIRDNSDHKGVLMDFKPRRKEPNYNGNEYIECYMKNKRNIDYILPCYFFELI